MVKGKEGALGKGRSLYCGAGLEHRPAYLRCEKNDRTLVRGGVYGGAGLEQETFASGWLKERRGSE